MTDILLLVSAIAILQVGGAYVRYTPFAGIMDDKTKRRLFYTDCLVLLINMSWMALLMNQLGLNVFTYKCCLALGWMPFFLAMFFIFPNAKAAQIFILGMQGIYMFALHGISAIFILLVFPDSPAENFLIEHLLVYDFFFALTLPGAYRVFSPMLPSKRFMNEKSYSYYIAAIPMILVTAATPTSLLGELWSIDKLFVWLILTIFFIAFDRYIILEKKDFENLTNIQSANHLMEKSISFLQSYAQILQDNGKEMSLFRHDLLHTDLALLAIDEMQTPIYGEIVLHILLQAHAEETAVLKTSLLLTGTGTLECYIMRVAVEGWLHVIEGYISEGIPSHQALWKLEGTVFYHLCIKTTIGTKVDVLEEDTIHGRLDFYTRLVCLNCKLMLC